AVYARAAWDRFNLPAGAFARTELDVSGYVGLVGQNVLAVRALRTDSNAPLDTAKLGVSVFADRGTVYPDGQRLADQKLREGYGGSVWLTAAVIRFSLAVAHGRGAATRVHFSGTLAF